LDDEALGASKEPKPAGEKHSEMETGGYTKEEGLKGPNRMNLSKNVETRASSISWRAEVKISGLFTRSCIGHTTFLTVPVYAKVLFLEWTFPF